MEVTGRPVDRRVRVRVVDKAPYTLECKACGRRWRPALGKNGRIKRYEMMCPNPACAYHGERRRRKK